jgi:hypothetical protein
MVVRFTPGWNTGIQGYLSQIQERIVRKISVTGSMGGYSDLREIKVISRVKL